MSWNRQECDSQDGTLILPRKLAASPLVRRTLHNIAAITQQYLSFKRRPGETMATFLVRETLGYEEFSEALQRLWEEQAGVDPAKLNFQSPATLTGIGGMMMMKKMAHPEDGNGGMTRAMVMAIFKKLKKTILQHVKLKVNLEQLLGLHLLAVALQDQHLRQLLILRDRGALPVELRRGMTQVCQCLTASS